MIMNKIKETLLPFFTLFTSLSTLLCCALPALLISLGLGTAMISLTSNFPAIIWLSKYKLILFIISGILLSVSGYFTYRKGQSCPTDPKLAETCMKVRKFNKIILWVSVTIYLIGLFFAYIINYFLG